MDSMEPSSIKPRLRNGHGSTKSGAEQLNLKEYVDTMKEGQNVICYVNGENISECIVEQIADVPVPQIMEELVGVEITNDFSEDGAVEDAGVKIEGVAISKRLTYSPVEGTSEFGYSTQQVKGHQSMQGSLEDLETRMQDADQFADGSVKHREHGVRLKAVSDELGSRLRDEIARVVRDADSEQKSTG